MITASCISNLIFVPFACLYKELFLMTTTVSEDSPSPPNPTHSSLCVWKLLYWSSRVKEWPSIQHVSALFLQNQCSLHWIKTLSIGGSPVLWLRHRVLNKGIIPPGQAPILTPTQRHFYASEPWYTSCRRAAGYSALLVCVDPPSLRVWGNVKHLTHQPTLLCIY